ncbi:trigger factor [Clostridia bacterium]|nr:trigger factor [Clostridia bacterium]
MSVKVEKLEKNFVGLEIEVSQEEFAKAYQATIKKMGGKMELPGFRKGKAPTALLEKNIGVEAILAEAADDVIPGAYYNAITAEDIEPIDRPDVELIKCAKDEPFIFKAKLQVKPEVTLGDYKGLEVNKKSAEVKKEMIDHEIETMRNRYAKIEDVEEGTLAHGDIALMDFEGFVDGVAFEGGKAENHSLEIGSGSFIPGFEDGMVGMVVGEEKDVKVTFPEEYHAENLAGKEAIFKVNLKSMKKKFLADLDDEFAKDVSEFETLDELKKDIEDKMKKALEDQSTNSLRMELMEKAAENIEVEIPQVMIDTKIDGYVKDLEQRLSQQGATLEQYLEFSGLDMDKVKEEYKPRAEVQVKIDLMLEAVVKAENIEVTDEDIDAELEKMAKMYGQDIENLKAFFTAQGEMKSLKQSIAFEKAIDLIQSEAKITEVSEEK